MTRFHLGRSGTLLSAVALAAVALTSSVGAKSIRRELQAFQEVPYAIVPGLTGLSEWTMGAPPKTLEFLVRCQSKGPTNVKLRGVETTVINGSPTRYDTNRKLGLLPARTRFTLSVAEGRNRTQGRIKYFK